MNIIYLIYSSGKASGGHFHSCDQISRALGNDINLKIVSIGTTESPVLVKNPHFEEHIKYYNFKDLPNLNKSLNSIKKTFNPDIIHCYDTESMNLILPLPSLWFKKIILTKCGGPNPNRKSWQYANSIINFSYENHNWFANNKSYKDINLHHIANRVNHLKFISEKDRREEKKKGVFNFVRIARIGGAYEKTLLDTFNLIESLKDNFNLNLYVIGRIQNQNRFEYLRQEAYKRRLPVKFITDERASKASNFLYLADCVIGTGRSFMEATSLGIPTLTPVKNNNKPVLVTKQNFDVFFKTNFSERNLADDISLNNNMQLISSLISEDEFYRDIKNESIKLFKKNFSTENITPKYKEVYLNCITKNKISKTDLIIKNSLYIINSLIK